MVQAKYKEWLTKEGLIKIEGWARDGLTDEQIAHNIGISRKTLADWKNKYSSNIWIARIIGLFIALIISIPLNFFWIKNSKS